MTSAFAAIGGVFLTMASVGIKAFKVLFDAALGTVSKIVGAYAAMPGPLGAPFRKIQGKVDGLKASGDKMFEGAIATTGKLKSELERLPKVTKIKGDIQDLEKKIRTAKDRLKDKSLTDPQRAKIKADIAQLEAQVTRARFRARPSVSTSATSGSRRCPVRGPALGYWQASPPARSRRSTVRRSAPVRSRPRKNSPPSSRRSGC